ncbi:MAG: MBL fold metallo-hydrolase [Lachnospiraceae bacterium]|nr:MBL fold metallo-hydrolase [Lachnospiraceae bacterium]
MKITYIHHSTFCVEVEGRVLVFDYYNGKGVPGCEYHGKMPEFPKETPIYVFSSHSHRDHFDSEVLNWSKRYDNIYYIFAKEVKKKLGNSMLKRLGFGEDIKEKITYVKPREMYEVGDAVVETLLSTDSGVAFLVTVSGKTIYHAGDLNWWRWEEETDVFNRYQEATYKQQINLLRGRQIDVSFVVADPRLKQSQFLGLDYFLEQVRTGCVILMHLWKHYEQVEKYLDMPEHQQSAERILVVKEENQVLAV